MRRADFLKLIMLLVSLSWAHATGLHAAAGQKFETDSGTVEVVNVSNLPFVQSEFTKRFKFDRADNPKLKTLREERSLDAIVAAGTNEFAQQILLMDWVHNQFKKFGQPSTPTSGALEILAGIDSGETFFCTQYAQLFASAAASLGWVDRVLALRRHQDFAGMNSSEHSTTEIWSNQFAKWVMLDPTSNMYLEKGGVPLNAFEIRQEWFYNDGRDLVFVIGKERRKYQKSDLPIFLKRFAGFGDLTVEPRELDKYGFIGYIPNTDLMDSGFDYGGMFIVQDALCAGTAWHKRTQPKNPATDPYFPINQAAVAVLLMDGKLTVELQTLTPNFDRFEIKNDNGSWERVPAIFPWPTPSRRLTARTVNQIGKPGPESFVELKVSR